jgi:hypothetical protein
MKISLLKSYRIVSSIKLNILVNFFIGVIFLIFGGIYAKIDN